MAKIKKRTNKGKVTGIRGEFKAGLAGLKIDVDLSGFFSGMVATQQRVENFKNRIAREQVLDHYLKLILKTPVWRGTARMAWYMEINGKRSGSGYRPNAVDSGIRPQVANIFGFPREAKYMAANAMTLRDKSPIKKLFGREYIRIETQGSYGRNTSAVTNMAKAAKNLIDNEFKVVEGGGPRSSRISQIRIGNDSPYLRYLSGDQYDASHKTWARIKSADRDFVRPGVTPSRDWIRNQNQAFQNRIDKIMSSKQTFSKYLGSKEITVSMRRSIIGDIDGR